MHVRSACERAIHAKKSLQNIRPAGEGVRVVEGQRASADLGQRAADLRVKASVANQSRINRAQVVRPDREISFPEADEAVAFDRTDAHAGVGQEAEIEPAVRIARASEDGARRASLGGILEDDRSACAGAHAGVDIERGVSRRGAVREIRRAATSVRD